MKNQKVSFQDFCVNVMISKLLSNDRCNSFSDISGTKNMYSSNKCTSPCEYANEKMENVNTQIQLDKRTNKTDCNISSNGVN